MTSLSSILLSPAILLGTLSSAQTVVHVVDVNNGPGTDFTDLQVAIDTVADGEVLLLRSGTYAKDPFGGSPFLLDGKGLSFVEDAGANVVTAGFTIGNLGTSQHVTLRGLTFMQGAGVGVQNSDAIVWLEDCQFDFNINGFPTAISATDVEGLVLNRCSATCFNAVASPGAVLGQVVATDSNVAMYDCSFDACDANPFAPSAMNGMILDGGTLFVSGSMLLGGDGCGGSGLLLRGNSPSAEILDSSVLAGFCSPATPDIDVQAGGYVVHDGDARSFQVTSPVSSGSSISLQYAGNPNDYFWLDVSLEPGFVVWPFTLGIWQLSPTGYLSTFFYGNLDAGGQATINIPLGPLNNAGQLWIQGDLMDFTSQKLTLAGGSHLLLLP